MMQTTTRNVVVMPSHDGSTYPNYSKKSSTCLGIFHLFLVFVLFLVSLIGVGKTRSSHKSYLIFPLIACALYIATGIYALGAGCSGKRRTVIISTVLNTICAVIAVIYAIVMVVAIVALNAIISPTNIDSYFLRHGSRKTKDWQRAIGFMLVLYYIVLFAYLVQTVITIWTSAIGWSVIRCGSTNQNDPPIELPTTRFAPIELTTPSFAPVVVPMDGQQMEPPSDAPPTYDEVARGYYPRPGMPPKY